MQTSNNFYERCRIRAPTILTGIHVRWRSQHLPSGITNVFTNCRISTNSWSHRLPKQPTQQRKGTKHDTYKVDSKEEKKMKNEKKIQFFVFQSLVTKFICCLHNFAHLENVFLAKYYFYKKKKYCQCAL